MCQHASFRVTRTAVLWSRKSPDHSLINAENGIKDDTIIPADIEAVSVELTPPDYDYSLPLDRWVFHVPQDILPDWWSKAEAELACREALVNYVKCHILTTGEHTIGAEENHIASGSAVVTVNKGGRCEYASGSAVVTVNKGGRCGSASDSAVVIVNAGGLCGSAYDSAVVIVNDGGLCGSAYGSAVVTVNKGGQCGSVSDSAVVIVNDGGQCESAYNSAVVIENDGGQCESAYGSAVVIENKGGRCGSALL